jgi:hypothetical protein
LKWAKWKLNTDMQPPFKIVYEIRFRARAVVLQRKLIESIAPGFAGVRKQSIRGV